MQYDDLKNDITKGTEVLSVSIKIPSFKEIKVIIDDADPSLQTDDGKIILHNKRVYSIEEYSHDYHTNKKKGYSWINMKFAGILEDDLVIVISYPHKIANYNFTSVNYSGPFNNVETGLPDWNFDNKYEIKAV